MMYRIVESPDCIPESNITLHVTYTGIKIKHLIKNSYEVKGKADCPYWQLQACLYTTSLGNVKV